MKKLNILLISIMIALSFNAFSGDNGEGLPFKPAGQTSSDSKEEAISALVDKIHTAPGSTKVEGVIKDLKNVKESITSDMLKKIREKQAKLADKPEHAVNRAVNNKANVNISKPKVERIKTIANYELIKNAQGSVTTPAMPDHDGVVRINGSKPGTYVVQIAKGYLNLIDLPFVEPVADTVNDVNITVKESGMYIYTNSEGSAGVWIYDKQNPKLSISLVFVPQNIAPRKIEVWYPDDVLYADYSPHPVPPTERVKTLDLSSAKKWEAKSSTYTDKILNIVDELSSNKVPPGYSLTVINDPASGLVCGERELVGTKKQFIDGAGFKVDVYEVANHSDYTVNINERNCYSKGVAAISLFPSNNISPGSSNEMYVLYVKKDKRKKLRIRDGLRPSVIVEGEVHE